MRCGYYDAGVCRSCTLIGTPYDAQLGDTDRRIRALLSSRVPDAAWLPIASGPESGFRNKAKLVVGGRRGAPTLGILDAEKRGVDLRDCGLYEPGLRAAVHSLAGLVAELELTPYDVARRTGELKNLLVTHSPDGELMVRFVLRSEGQLAKLTAGLPSTRRALPSARVVTANLLPAHVAALEGTREVVLTDERLLPMRVAGLTLQLGPQSFFQTNTAVASRLYEQAGAWVSAYAAGEIATAWDLYCGVGGFAQTLARALPDADVTGVELSEEAVSAAAVAAPGNVTFVAADAGAYAAETPLPELLVVNPPRRGLDPALCAAVESGRTRWLLYSSCNAETLARDLRLMPSLAVVQARVFAMFPQTHHAETLVLCRRTP